MTTKQHGSVRLTWNEVDADLWQASAIGHDFSIIKCNDGTFSMRTKTAETISQRVGNFSTLKQAQFRAQRLLDAIQGEG